MEEEPHLQILHCRKRLGTRSRIELERHGRCIIGDAVKRITRIRDGGKVCEAEEGLKGPVSAEFDGDLAFALGCDGVVQTLQYLGCEGGASDGADGVGGIVGEVELVLVG